jgi:hypothetical protein
MPFSWNVETERAMLLVACAELRPNPATWQVVADRLGGGLNANAVRCALRDYYYFLFSSLHRARHYFLMYAIADLSPQQSEVLQAQEGGRRDSEIRNTREMCTKGRPQVHQHRREEKAREERGSKQRDSEQAEQEANDPTRP